MALETSSRQERQNTQQEAHGDMVTVVADDFLSEPQTVKPNGSCVCMLFVSYAGPVNQMVSLFVHWETALCVCLCVFVCVID